MGIESNESFDDRSNEKALTTIFQKDSIFYTPQYVTENIDFVKLAKIIIARKDIIFDYKDYIGKKTELINISGFGYFTNETIPEIVDAEIPLKNKKLNENTNLLLKGKLNKLIDEVNIFKNNESDTTAGLELEFNYPAKEVSFKLHYYYVGKKRVFENNNSENNIAFTISTSVYNDFLVFLNVIKVEYASTGFEFKIEKEYLNAFQKANNNKSYLGFLYQTAPDFILAKIKDEDLFNNLTFLSNEWFINKIGVDENIAIINLINAFKDKKWFVSKVNENPTCIRNIFNKFSPNYLDQFIILFSKIGNLFWTKEDKEKAWNFDLYYSEFDKPDPADLNSYDSYTLYTGFAYYNEALKMFKIGTAIFVYQDRYSFVPLDSREIGPDGLQFAFEPMKLTINNNTVYIPIFIAEYLTNVKIDEEFWAMMNNIVIFLLPESSATTRTISTIAKLFKGKKIKTIEELIKFLDKIDDSVKATELEQYGIEALFRGTARNAQGELFAGNLNSIENGTSTSTDPIRAVIYGIESSSIKGAGKGFLQIYLPKNLEGLYLQAPNAYRFDLELEVIIKTNPKELSKFTVIEIPIEDARRLVKEVYGVNLDTRMSRNTADIWLEETKKLSPKDALEFYKKVIKLEK